MFVEEMYIFVEYQYIDYSIYFDEQDNRKQGQEYEIVKEFLFIDVVQCLKENENVYNLLLLFMR